MELADDAKKMTSSIAILVKAITPNRAVIQNNSVDSGVDSQTVQGAANPLKVSELETSQKGDKRFREDQPGASGSTTYMVEEATREFLNTTFALKKPVDNKILLLWERKLDKPDCDIIHCPKLDPIVECS